MAFQDQRKKVKIFTRKLCTVPGAAFSRQSRVPCQISAVLQPNEHKFQHLVRVGTKITDKQWVGTLETIRKRLRIQLRQHFEAQIAGQRMIPCTREQEECSGLPSAGEEENP